MKKGISPLLATVMLIGIVIAVTALISSWFVSMIKSQQEEIEEGGEKQIECINAQLDIVRVICSNSTEQLKITIHNVGGLNLYDFSTFAEVNNTHYINSTGGPNSTHPLSPGEQYTLIYHCSDTEYCAGDAKVNTVRISPGNCPQVYDEESVDIACS